MLTRGSRILLLPAVLGATALFFSTGAAFVGGPTDSLTDEVALQPGDNPYTYLDEEDELVINVTEDNPNLDFDGVNLDAFVAEEALFYVAYDANTTGELWIEHDSTAVTFVVDGDSIERADDPLLLTPEGDRVAVGVEVDTRIVDVVPGDRLIDDIAVYTRPAEPETPTNVTASDSDSNQDDEADPNS